MWEPADDEVDLEEWDWWCKAGFALWQLARMGKDEGYETVVRVRYSTERRKKERSNIPTTIAVPSSW